MSGIKFKENYTSDQLAALNYILQAQPKYVEYKSKKTRNTPMITKKIDPNNSAPSIVRTIKHLKFIHDSPIMFDDVRLYILHPYKENCKYYLTIKYSAVFQDETVLSSNEYVFISSDYFSLVDMLATSTSAYPLLTKNLSNFVHYQSFLESAFKHSLYSN